MGTGDKGTDQRKLNRWTERESHEHTDYIHKGGRDNWAKVKHIRVVQARKRTKGGSTKRDIK